jgi:cytochrome b6-f complex iron-sulfur subunit
VNRREFIRRLEVLSTGAAVCGAGVSLTGCLGFHWVNSSLVDGKLVVRRAELGGSRFALVEAPGFALPIFLRRAEDGSFSAVSTRCMHRGCQVEPAADKLVCPCHGSEYTETGEVLKGPTERPLRRYPVAVEGDSIAIDLPAGGDAL